MTVRLGATSKGRRKADHEAEEAVRYIVAAAGKPSKEEQRAAAAGVYEARRALWESLRAGFPAVVVRRLRERADNADDNSNRLGVDDMRRAVADWLEGEAATGGKRKRAGQTSLPLLTADVAEHATPKILRDILRAGLRVDLVADRDGEVTMAAAKEVAEGGRPCGPPREEQAARTWAEDAARAEVRRRLAAMRRALNEGVRLNGRLVVAAFDRRYFVGDDAALSGADLLSAGLDGARRGLMDYQPSIAGPATHLLQWINQRMARTLESGRIIASPAWVRDIASKARHLGCDLDLLRDLLSLVESLPAAADEEGGRALAGVILDAMRRAYEDVEAPDGEGFTMPALALRCALQPPQRRHEAALAPLLANMLGTKAANAEKAIRHIPSRVVGEEEGATIGGDGHDEIEEAMRSDELWSHVDAMRALGGRHAEAAEVIERLFSGVAETIVDIASHPLASGRKASKAEVGHLRDFGLAWLRQRLAPAAEATEAARA